MKVLLLVDIKNWAWDIKAQYLKKYLPEFDIHIKLQSEFSGKHLHEYGTIHSFGWMGINYPDKITTAISSHNYELKHKPEAIKKLPRFSGLTCVSKILFNKIKTENLNKRLYLCENGVDETLFYPDKNKSSEKFVVGWVAQKTGGTLDGKGKTDIKGYEHVLLPLKERLQKYSDIEFLIHSNNCFNAKSHETMKDIYNKMDLFITTSLLEGTPNPAFEAASCGIPIISTEVGCIPELIENNRNGFLITPYNNKEQANKRINDFVEKILFLKNNRELAKSMGEENRKEIEKNWTWKERAKQWIPVFENHRTK